MSASDGRVSVLYIMGLWRSGSTILDIILGNHEQLESAGELRSLPVTGWSGHETCACGAPAESCEYWTQVRAEWTRRVGADRTPRLVELQDQFERMRSLPRVMAGSTLRSRGFREYTQLTAALYGAIAQVSGKRVVVDSTKYPARALALSRNRDVQLYLVHLVRDGRAVVWSMHRKPNVDLAGDLIDIPTDEVANETARQWLRVNLFSSLLSSLPGARSIRLRYEDLVTDPERELSRIGTLLDLDFGPLAQRLLAGESLDVGHMIAGNRVRHAAAVRLRPDLEWQEKLSPADRDSFWKRAGWLAQRYGYVR